MYQQNSFFTKKQIIQNVNKTLEEGLNKIMEDVKIQLDEIIEQEKGSEDALTPEDIEKCLKKVRNEVQLLLLEQTKENMREIRQKNIENNPSSHLTPRNV